MELCIECRQPLTDYEDSGNTCKACDVRLLEMLGAWPIPIKELDGETALLLRETCGV